MLKLLEAFNGFDPLILLAVILFPTIILIIVVIFVLGLQLLATGRLVNGKDQRRSIWEMLQRADSGLSRFLLSCLFVLLSFIALYFAQKLMVMGVKGEFTILSEFKGVKLYIFSLSPSLAFLVFGCFVIWPGLSFTLKSIYHFKQGQK